MVLAAGKMYRPTDVAVDIANNAVYVVEQFNHRISKWTYTDTNFDFTLDSTWGDKNPTDGTLGGPGPVESTTDSNLYRPSGIAFDATNTLLYVTDTFHNRVRVIDPTGTGAFTTSIGQGGFGTSDFYRPAGIAIDAPGHDTFIVIADELNHRAVRYDTGSPPTNPLVLTDPSTLVGGLSFIRPHGVVFDAVNELFNVSDSQRGLIAHYDMDASAILSQIGTPGTSGNDLFFPSSGHGNIEGTSATVFADTRNNSLKHLNNQTIGTSSGIIPGTGDGELYYPESVSAFVDAVTNYVLAANTLNNRVEVYSNATFALNFESNFGSP